MKLPFVIIAFMCYSVSIAQRVDSKIIVNNQPREFITVKPSGLSPSGGYPMVFMLHGTSGDGEKFYNISGWKELGEKEKIVTVFPTALTYCWVEDGIQKNTTKWSDSETFGKLCPGETPKDDISFFRKMIDTITKVLPINKKMIFVSGFSSGGVMASKLGVDLAGIISAAGCSAGFLNENDTVSSLKPKIPFWEIIGTHDSHFLESSFKRPAPFNDSILAWTQFNIRNYLNTLDLTDKYSKDSTPISLTYEFKTPVPGNTGGYFKYTLFKGLEHEYFNGKNYLPNNTSLPTEAELFWEFFKQAVNTITPVQEIKLYTPSIRAYPNPSKNVVYLDFTDYRNTEPIYIQIMDLTGKLVKTTSLQHPGILPLYKSSIGEGLFILKTWQGNNNNFTKIIFE